MSVVCLLVLFLLSPGFCFYSFSMSLVSDGSSGFHLHGEGSSTRQMTSLVSDDTKDAVQPGARTVTHEVFQQFADKAA